MYLFIFGFFSQIGYYRLDRLPLVYIRVLVDYLLNSLLKNMILKAHIIGLKLFNSYHWIFISDFLL